MRIWVYVSVFIVLSGCKGDRLTISMATTSSVFDSGLLDYLLGHFERQRGIKVRAIVVGTGKALRLAQEGNVDCVFVHSKEDEERFVAEGYGARRIEICTNNFVLVGPRGDPQGIRYAPGVLEAFRYIYDKGVLFASRGDNSGTHRWEKQLWDRLGLDPSGLNWYRETGSNMCATLEYAFQKGAYTLVDTATFLRYKNRGYLEVVKKNGPLLLNVYSFIVATKARYPRLARQLGQWLINDGRKYIAQFKVGDTRVFNPLGKTR
jgi:tungstate transport system substrate-binding protein